MRSHLKVKVFSLAAEMQYIHRQEVKWKQKARAARQREKAQAEEKNQGAIDYCMTNFWSQRAHRLHLKYDARWSHLAYGFMKGRSYEQMEYICYGDMKGFGSCEPNWARIEEIVTNFSKDEPTMRDIMQRFSEWKAAALVWYEGNEQRILAMWEAAKANRERLAKDEDHQSRLRRLREIRGAEGLQAAADGWIKRNGRWTNPVYEAEIRRLSGGAA